MAKRLDGGFPENWIATISLSQLMQSFSNQIKPKIMRGEGTERKANSKAHSGACIQADAYVPQSEKEKKEEKAFLGREGNESQK